MPSWAEHMRQHEERWTGADRDWRNAALALTDGTALVVEHLFPPQLDMTRLAHPPPGGPSAST